MDEPKPVTYGEFPELFAGFPADEPVDLDDDRTHSAIVFRADKEAWRRLYPPEWYEVHRPRKKSEEESMHLAERILGPGTSQRTMAGPEGDA